MQLTLKKSQWLYAMEIPLARSSWGAELESDLP
jgi:hypothetical protein